MLGHYVDDSALFLHTSTSKPLAECRAFVISNLKKGGQFEFKDPQLDYLDREINGDRVRKTTTLHRYIQSSLKAEEIIAPTFTTYLNAKVDKSILAIYVENNLAVRGKAKKAQFSAKAAGNDELATLKKIEQTGRKLANNAISGAHVSASTPLYNKTAHSTLTSTCRATAGYGNANNEKFLSGNRHYYNHHIVLNNIVSVISSTNYEKLNAVISKYALHIPTVDEVMACVTYSSSMYWWDRPCLAKVRNLVEKLNPAQRAAFVYKGDAHHLLKHNSDMMRVLLTRLSDRVTGVHPEPLVALNSAPESYINLAHQICSDITRGIGKDYTRIKNPEDLSTLALTVDNIAHCVVDYADLIECLWMPETLPASVGYFPESIRRTAVTSDTDSTIFTVQDWVIWYSGKPSFDARSRGVYCAVVFLASMSITHILAVMSANLGIEEKYINTIAMKSEFTFDVFCATSVGKHYFAAISCQEGNVGKELEYEIKGVQLKSANAPRAVIAAANEMMKKIIHDTMETGTIVLTDYLKTVADMERSIEASIRAGETTYLRSGSIKDIASYAGEPTESPYQNHFFWEEVWADKYGHIPEPPYATRKIPVSTDTPSKLKAWIGTIKDPELKKRLITYLARTGKPTIGTFNIPAEILTTRGIPEEILEIFDFEKLQLDICRIFYLILETIGYFAVGDKTKKLVSRNGF